jgi:MFS family permease
MQITVLGLLVAKASGSAVDVGIVMAGQFVPGLFGAPIGGVLADRFDRRQTLLWSQAVQTLVTGALAVAIASGERRAVVIGLFLLVQGFFVSMGQAVSGAMQPDLVPKEELLAAVSLGSASWNSGRVFGPLLAFVVERASGATGAIIGNAVTFALVGFAIWSLRRPFPPGGAFTVAGGAFSQVVFGARTLWSTPGCRAAVQGILPMQFLFAPVMALLPLAAGELGGGQGLMSTLSTSQGIGAVLGAALLPSLVARAGRDRALQAHWIVTALAVLALGLFPNPVVTIVAICVFGGAFTGVLVSFMGLVSRDAPPEARGRVMSVFSAMFGPTYGMGVALQSVMANQIGRADTHRLTGSLGIAVLGLSVMAVGWSGWKAFRHEVRSPAALAA